MAIDLLQSFLQRGNQISTKTENSSLQTVTSTPANQQILRAIKALQAGQTLQGEILSVKGDQVQLEVLKEVIIDARLSGALNLTPGTNMTFQVKGNQGGSLSLMPLFTNVSTDPNVLKALDMAGITVNERTTEMVQLMMEKGMPIHKQSLLEMYREVISYKELPVTDIISLKQLGMAVTSDNLEQLTLYKNNDHFLTNGFSAIGKELSAQINMWMQQGKIENVSNLLQQLHQVFHGMDKQGLGSIPYGEGGNHSSEFMVLNGEDVLPEEVVGRIVEENGQNKILGEETLQGRGQILTEEGAKKTGEEKVQNLAVMKPDTLEVLAQQIKELKSPSKLSRLFEKIWEREVRDQWLLPTEEIGQKDKISHLYESLDKHIKQLEQVLEKQISSQAAATKAVHSASANIDFMNQLNQMHAYLQLPMKMLNQNATGELYVFTNKKSLQEKEGRVTALLHLDMEYLGPLDIHVAMENRKVSTQFFLQKEEYLEFLEKHMDLLTSRLQKRGYDCSITTKLRKEEETKESMIEKIAAKEGGKMLLSTRAFDMRA